MGSGVVWSNSNVGLLSISAMGNVWCTAVIITSLASRMSPSDTVNSFLGTMMGGTPVSDSINGGGLWSGGNRM